MHVLEPLGPGPKATMAVFITCYLVISFFSSALASVIPRVQALPANNNTEALAERLFFYVGGKYVNATLVSRLYDLNNTLSN